MNKPYIVNWHRYCLGFLNQELREHCESEFDVGFVQSHNAK